MNVEANVEYAVMIRTRGSSTDTAIGLYNGSICLITGRPGYTDGNPPINPPENAVTMESQNVWKEGLIAKNSLGNPEEVVDPTLGGGYSTMTAADLKLINNLPGLEGVTLFDYLNTTSVNLFRCEIQFFAVIDGAFKLWGTYSIENITNEEHLVGLTAVDGFLTIHKETLRNEVSPAGFPAAPEDSQGKFIPLCIGRIPEAALLPVTGQIVRQMLCKPGTVEYELAQIKQVFTDTQFIIKTGSMPFDPLDLKHKYIRVARTSQTNVEYTPSTIFSNGSSADGTMLIILDSSFGAMPIGSDNPGNSLSAWWVQVYGLSNFNAVSDGPIHSFTPPLLGYDDDQNKFIPIEGKVIKRYPLDGEEEHPPFADVSGVAARPEGDFAPYQPQDGFQVYVKDPERRGILLPNKEFDIITINRLNSQVVSEEFPQVWFDLIEKRDIMLLLNPVWQTYPDLSGSLPKLVNGITTDGASEDDNKYVRRISFKPEALTKNSTVSGLGIIDGVMFEIPLPDDLLLGSDEELDIAVDADFIVTSSKLNGLIRLRAWLECTLMDVYGQATSLPIRLTIVAGTDGIGVEFNGDAINAPYKVRQVGSFYYHGAGKGSTARKIEGYNGTINNGNFFDLLRDPARRKSVKSLRVKMVAQYARNTYGIISSTGIGLSVEHALRQVVLSRKKDTYIGAKYHYVTGVDFGMPADTGLVWGGRRYPHKPVLSIPDAIEYLMRVRDGAGDKVDTDSFDNSLYQRSGDYWYVGRQITEQKNTKDYIEELCKHGFLALVPGRNGKRRLIPLNGYDNPGVVATYDESSILDGSVGDSAVTGLDRVYTGLELRYDKNPATGEYRSAVYIRKTEQEAFPAYSADPNAEWTQYAGGFPGGEDGYNDAQACWLRYRAAYLVSHRQNIYKLDCDWFQSNARVRRGAENLQDITDTAAYLAYILSEWYSGPRVPYTFRVPLNADNVDRLQLLNRVLFRDVKRTGDLYYKTLVERVALDTTAAQIEVTVSRLATDGGYPSPADAEPLYITEIIDGDTLTETIGGDTLTEIINA